MTESAHTVHVTGRTITTPRLRLRPWHESDAQAALDVFGSEDVARWLAPAMSRVPDVDAMRERHPAWGMDAGADRTAHRSLGHRGRSGRRLIGAGSIRPLPPEGDDLEIAWQLAPAAWGHGYATEAGHALAHYAFDHGEDEVFAVVRPRNERGVATARRVGMEWVGETDKYYDLTLQVFRLRKGDLDISAPHAMSSPA